MVWVVTSARKKDSLMNSHKHLWNTLSAYLSQMTTSQVVVGSLRLCQKQYHTACFDVCGVDKFFGDAASVHFIFEAGTSPVAVLSGKLDQVPLYGGRNRICLSWMGGGVEEKYIFRFEWVQKRLPTLSQTSTVLVHNLFHNRSSE